MRSRLLACLAAILLVLSGCDAIVHSIFENDVEPPVRDEADVRAIGQQFGEAVMKENYRAAYQLLTSSRRAEKSLEQFTAKCKQQRQLYFEEATPDKVDTYAYMPFEDDLPNWSGLPGDVKYDALLGICTVIWEHPQMDAKINEIDGEVETYVSEVDVVVVDESGQPKIAHIDW